MNLLPTTLDQKTRKKLKENDKEVYQIAWLLSLDTGEKHHVKKVISKFSYLEKTYNKAAEKQIAF